MDEYKSDIEDKGKRLLQPISFLDACNMIDVIMKRGSDPLLTHRSIGSIRKGKYTNIVLDDVICPDCDCLRDTYWVCQDCRKILCYGCLIDSHTHNKLPKGEYIFKCECGSVRLFLKHNILTVPFGYR